MTTTTYRVEGMTCDHCVRTVSAALSKLHGVTAVDVDLARGEVSVTSDRALDAAEVRAVVDEAGYSLGEE